TFACGTETHCPLTFERCCSTSERFRGRTSNGAGSKRWCKVTSRESGTILPPCTRFSPWSCCTVFSSIRVDLWFQRDDNPPFLTSEHFPWGNEPCPKTPRGRRSFVRRVSCSRCGRRPRRPRRC